MSERETASRIGHRALEWLCGKVDFITSDLFHAPLPSLSTKALFDLAVLVRCRAHRFGLTKRDTRLAQVMVDIVESEAYSATLRRHPRDLHLYGLPYAAAKAVGATNMLVEQTIADLVADGALLYVERKPYEQLGVLHFLECLGLNQQTTRAEDVMAMTLVALGPAPALVGAADAYALAHTVFYVTDFGRRRTTLLPRPSSETVLLLKDLLCRYQAADAPDLVAELATAIVCMTSQVDQDLNGTLSFLDRRQRPDGTIALHQNCVRMTAGASPYSQHAWFHQHVHSVVVTALFASLVEHRSLAPFEHVGPDRSDRSAV